MTFSKNAYFSNETLEKKFWYRRSKSDWCGLVSEPVRIDWKEGKDLTGGLLDLVCDAYVSEQVDVAKSKNGKMKEKAGLTPEQKALKKKIDGSGLGGLSFFAWFGYIGRRISAKESEEANEVMSKSREERRKGNGDEEKEATHSAVLSGLNADDDDAALDLEIFPDGDELAIAITEDLWPGAIKYFSMSSSFPPSRLPIYTIIFFSLRIACLGCLLS